MTEINLWTIESKIYPKLDAIGMLGETSFNENSFDLGANQKLAISVSSKNGSPISLHQQFNSSDIDFKMDFRSGNDNWFRVDNQLHNYLHIHLQSGTQPFEVKTPIPETTTISGLISATFAKAEEIVKWKFPEFIIGCGSSFVGTT
jgi:hypothetical protein